MKVHFKISIEPLDFSRDLPMAAECNSIVDHPRPEMMLEMSQRGAPDFSPLRDCSKCADLITKAIRFDIKQYVYAIVNDEEAMHRDTE